jgi:hypothetical protein
VITWDSIGLMRATAYDPDGILGLQPEYTGEQAGPDAGGGPALVAAHPFGLLSRPRDPEVDPAGNPSVGANLLVAYDGDEGFALPTGDPRALAKLTEITKGSTVLYADTDTPALLRLLLDAAAGRLTASSPGGTTLTLENGAINLAAGTQGAGRVGDRVTGATITLAPTPSGPPGIVVTILNPPSTTDPAPLPITFTILGLLTLAPAPITFQLLGTISEGSSVVKVG